MSETPNIIDVPMNGVDVSTNNSPIIGTTSLGPCIGLLIYDRENKKALVSHLSANWDNYFINIIEQLLNNELLNEDEIAILLILHETFTKYMLYDYFDEKLVTMFMEKYKNYTNRLNKLEIYFIEGSIKSEYNTIEKLTNLFNSLNGIFTVRKTPLHASITHKEPGIEPYNEFIFDSRTGEFITTEIKLKKEKNPSK